MRKERAPKPTSKTKKSAPKAAEAAIQEDIPSLETEALFLSFVEAQGAKHVDPLSNEALELQAKYISQVGDHPLDVLKTLARNPFVKPSDRINAAKVLLEYGTRKPGTDINLSAPTATLNVDMTMFSGLSAKDLKALEELLSKAQGGNDAGTA